MITGHHRTDDKSPSELAWEAIKGHAAIAEAVTAAAERHAQIVADRDTQLRIEREQPAVRRE